MGESIKESRKLAGDNPILKDVVSYMEKYSSNIDNLKFLDQQAEFMKVFETDKLKAKEDGLKIGIDRGKAIGIDEGKAIGSDNKAIEIAKKMLSTDASIDYIAEMTGLYKEKTVTTAFKNNRSIHNGDWLVERKQIGYTGWNIVVVNSMSNLLVENRRFHYIVWFILLLVGAILILLDFQVFRNFTDPVYQLLATMEDFGKGNYNSRAKEEGIGEIKSLSANFNIMADKLQKQMEEIRQNEREKQKMEKKLLQSQINPHFLYNTLDSIIWMIRSEEYEGAGEMVSSLAKFFRISLSQGKDMIPLGKELEHATSYLKIQNIRFKDKFDFNVEADPKLMKYLIPKLSIQPLLENAIYHGMEGMYEDGEIIISVYEEEDTIKIDVADNGLGMTEDKLEYIMHHQVVSSKRGSGIGVRNVHERIQLIYGKQYGVTITSELDEGTTATITIPKMEEADETE